MNTLQRTRTCNPWWLRLCILLLGTLTACGGGTTVTTTNRGSTDTRAQTPQAVHQAWVQATRVGNIATAQSLATAQLKNVLPGQFATPGAAPWGALRAVQITDATIQGQLGSGVSVWRFTNKTQCYTTDLAQLDGAWQVANWHASTCPAGT